MNSDIKDVVAALGVNDLAEALAVSPSAIRIASHRGKFPCAWYLIVKKIAADSDIELNDNLFAFRLPVRRND